jgi:hypothetical protein
MFKFISLFERNLLNKCRTILATAKKILKLDTLTIEDNFFENAALVGIASDKPIYSLCHLLNESFQLSFARKPLLDVQIGKKNQQQFSFAVYQSPVPKSVFTFTLYKLKIEDILLLPTVKNIDYIWLILGEDLMDAEDLAMVYLKKLRAMPEIQFATLLEKEKIKNIEYLVI